MRRSLRSRLVFATVMWAAGVLAASFVVGRVVLMFHPGRVLLIHNSFIIIISTVLVTAGISVIRRGLSPFAILQQRLHDVRSGRTSRLEGDYPSEVEPLVDDLNTLLEEREHRVARAVAKAGDLAHGLKTPLAILAQEIDRASAAGQTDFAASLREQVDRMRRQIDSHLAQARANAGGTLGARASVGDAVQALVRAMQRLYADRRLTFRIELEAGVSVRVPSEDLEEMLGNLLDNACKWASTEVVVSARGDADRVIVEVEDDGAGLSEEMREAVLKRGVRADETAPGSGLGLAIVQDLAEAYGGSIALAPRPGRGLRASLTLPRQP